MRAPTIAEIMSTTMTWYKQRMALKEGELAAAYYQGRRDVRGLSMFYFGPGYKYAFGSRQFTGRLVENRIQAMAANDMRRYLYADFKDD